MIFLHKVTSIWTSFKQQTGKNPPEPEAAVHPSAATNPIPADVNLINTPSSYAWQHPAPTRQLSLPPVQINPGPGGEQLAAVHESCFTYMSPYKHERRASGINALAC